jgi:hypothetical protein
MKNILVLVSLLITSMTLFGQEDLEKISDSIAAEGLRLYKSEMASWYGTDIFLEKHKNRVNIGGYFSYSDNNIAKCIFFSKGDTSKVIGTISFDTLYKVNTAQVDLAEREFTNSEKQLYAIRRTALKTINSDTLFKTYKNTNLNLIPLISNGQKKVYVLTGPEQNGIVIFGNDYLLNFKDNNDLLDMRRLHKNIISLNYGNASDTTIVGTMHSHLPETGNFITATDICTLMLYEKFAKWQQHYVISKNYVCIWDCNKNILAILTKQAWDNINNDQKKRHKNN